MTGRYVVLGAVAAWVGLLSYTPARAQEWLDRPGALGAATSTVGHANVRMPPGDWQPIAQYTDVPLQNGGDSMEIEVRTFAQRSADRVAALMVITSNITRSGRGWAPDRICSARDVVVFENRSETRNFDCMVVNHRMMVVGENPSEAAAARFAKLQAFGTLPHQMVGVTFAQSSGSRLDFVRVAIYFSPVLAGFADDPNQTWLGSVWHKARIDAEHHAYVDKVTRWARAYHDTVAGSF